MNWYFLFFILKEVKNLSFYFKEDFKRKKKENYLKKSEKFKKNWENQKRQLSEDMKKARFFDNSLEIRRIAK